MTDNNSTPSIITIGNALLDHTYKLSNLPEPDGGAYILDYTTQPGGVEMNVAALLGALGHDTGIITKLGDDDDGKQVKAHLNDIGIDCSRLRIDQDVRTMYCLVLMDNSGQRMILGGGNSLEGLTLSDPDFQYLRKANAIFVSAYTPLSVINSVIDRVTWCPIVFDLAGSFTDLSHRGFTRDNMKDIINGVDILITNHSAAESLLETDCEPNRLAQELRKIGASVGAITSGNEGAVVFDNSQTLDISALSIDVTDTTGAGDAFTAGFMHSYIIDDQSLEKAGQFATTYAGLNCQREGAHSNPPNLSAIEESLCTYFSR
ncbi:MAG: carbohydrate kinase family protein [Halobacteriaceae archaeon]